MAKSKSSIFNISFPRMPIIVYVRLFRGLCRDRVILVRHKCAAEIVSASAGYIPELVLRCLCC